MSDAQTCEMRFYFAQQMKLIPKELPVAMRRGLRGHEMFEEAFKCLQNGGDLDGVLVAIQPIVLRLQSEQDYESLKAYRLVLAFVAHVIEEGHEVVSVEVSQFVGVEGNDFVFTPDIVLRYTKGPKRGQLFMLDFKFTAQPWTANELGVYQQGPKYVRYWNRTHDEQVHFFYLVCLITTAAAGATGDRLFRVLPVKLNKPKLDRIEWENEQLLKRVETLKANGLDQSKYLRTVNTFSCKRCFFASDLCPISLEGKSIDKYIKVNYNVNDYFASNYGEDV
jgi:flagellar biosynthesis regulator FlbT